MDSAPAATRMGSRSSTRHGGPAQVFTGPVRKWRKVWLPVSSSSPSPSAARVVLYKWNPLTSSNGGAKEDSATPEETTPPPTRPVKYLPVAAVIQRRKDEIARKEEEEAEAEANGKDEMQEENESKEDAAVQEVQDSVPNQDENPEPSSLEVEST